MWDFSGLYRALLAAAVACALIAFTLGYVIAWWLLG